MSRTVCLISCVKSKLATSAPACNLYTSPLFIGMKRYAERNADKWFILSALYGLLLPNQIVSPYEKTLNSMKKSERDEWAHKVQLQLSSVLESKSNVIILAGIKYRDGIAKYLQDCGHTITIPMKDMKMGPQLRWLKEANRV